MKKTSMEMEHSGKLKITAFHFTHSERQLPELPTLSVSDIHSFFFLVHFYKIWGGKVRNLSLILS